MSLGHQQAPLMVSNHFQAATTNSGLPAKPLVCDARMIDRSTAAVNIEAEYNLPAQLLFELLADPTKHTAIFKSIEAADAELLEDNGSQRKWRLDYLARWKFWKVSGVCQNRMYLYTDSNTRTVTFKLREPGFLKKYEGTWTISAVDPTTSSLSSSGSSCKQKLHSRSDSDLLGLTTASHTTVSSSMQPPMASIQPTASPAATAAAAAGSSMRKTVSFGSLNALLSSNLSTGAAAVVTLPWRQQQQQMDSMPVQDGDQKPYNNCPHKLLTTSNATAAAAAAVISIQSVTSPCRCPPPPLNALLKQQCKGQASEMLEGLVMAAAAAAAAAPQYKLEVQPLRVT